MGRPTFGTIHKYSVQKFGNVSVTPPPIFNDLCNLCSKYLIIYAGDERINAIFTQYWLVVSDLNQN